jgi:hypothetical protein
MYLAASKIKQKYQIDDVKQALDDALAELEDGLTVTTTDHEQEDDDHDDDDNNNNKYQALHSIFLSGSSTQPHLGDLCVFGVLKGLEGLPILTDSILQDDRFPKVCRWYHAMNDVVESKKLQVRA